MLDTPDTPATAGRKRWRRVFLIFTAVASGLWLLSLGISSHIDAHASSRIYGIENCPARRVAIVFGARVYKNGEPCWPLALRLRAAATLYQSGRIEKILVSGDNRRHHYNEPERMRDWLIANGVPENDIVCDYAGFRTLDTCARAQRLWGLESAILVSQRYHLPRALYLAQAFGMDAIGVACDGTGGSESKRDHLREHFARILAWIDVHVLDREPHFWGPEETI